MKLAQIREAADRVMRLLDDYSSREVGSREMQFDPILYGYLEGRFHHFSRQHRVRVGGYGSRRRIDFRHGTSHPMVMELAVRSPQGGGQLYGSTNSSELRKLCRVTQASAQRRVLLLVDLHAHPLDKERLKQTYESQSSGRGNFRRHSVRVIYVHRSKHFDFLWRP
jgi:hypothetical protein